MGKTKDLTGKKFGRLTVLRKIGKDDRSNVIWECQCDCGNKTNITTVRLNRGTKSCGCLVKETAIKTGKKNTKHNKCNTSEYTTYKGIKGRCYNTNNKDYPSYGGRGIKVCDRWIESFQNFYDDMGPKPSKKHSLDRIDNNGDYEPNNCRWANLEDQNNNRRSNKYITYNNETLTYAQWSRRLGGSDGIVHGRIKRGWDPIKAITTPVRKNNTYK